MARKEAVVNFYDRWILPPILDLVMRQHQLQKYRREVVAAANGRVLEVGVGSGLNFSRYGKQVEIVFGIDPSLSGQKGSTTFACATGICSPPFGIIAVFPGPAMSGTLSQKLEWFATLRGRSRIQ